MGFLQTLQPTSVKNLKSKSGTGIMIPCYECRPHAIVAQWLGQFVSR